MTTTRAFKKCSEILSHDATLTSAHPDRLAHHLGTVSVHANSYHIKDHINI